MDFFEFKNWLKERNLTFKLEGWSGCIPDTIIVFKDKCQVYEGDYNKDVNYQEAVDEIVKCL